MLKSPASHNLHLACGQLPSIPMPRATAPNREAERRPLNFRSCSDFRFVVARSGISRPARSRAPESGSGSIVCAREGRSLLRAVGRAAHDEGDCATPTGLSCPCRAGSPPLRLPAAVLPASLRHGLNWEGRNVYSSPDEIIPTSSRRSTCTGPRRGFDKIVTAPGRQFGPTSR